MRKELGEEHAKQGEQNTCRFRGGNKLCMFKEQKRGKKEAELGAMELERQAGVRDGQLQASCGSFDFI